MGADVTTRKTEKCIFNQHFGTWHKYEWKEKRDNEMLL